MRRASRALSIIELMVVIAIIGILVSITLPALAKARISARETIGLSNLRQTGVSFDMYADRFGVYPFAPRVESPFGGGGGGESFVQVPWYPEGTIVASSDPWSLDRLWPGLVQSVAPFEESYPLWVSPGGDRELPEAWDWDDVDERGPLDQVSLTYSNSFLASPKLWKEGSAADWSLFRGVKPGEVVFPSAKVLLWDGHLAYLPREPEEREGHWDHTAPMVFADGHASLKNPLKAREGVANPLQQRRPIRLHDTGDGVAGMDY